MDLTQADDADLQESMGWFEAALSAKEPKLIEPGLNRILLAMDGSNQDQTTLRLASALARRDGAIVIPLYAYEGPPNEAHERYVLDQAEALEAADIRARTPAAPEFQERSFDRILLVASAERCELIVMPAPYLDDFRELGGSSIGTNLDMLMSRSPVPLLIVREPRDDPQHCLENILLSITPSTGEVIDAAAWALRLVGEGGRLRILAVVDARSVSSAERVLRDTESLDEEMLTGLQQPAIAGLIAALQRRSAERNLGCRVSVRSGDAAKEVAKLAEEDDSLMIVASPRDPESGAYQRVQAVVRSARNPVMVV